MRKLARLCTLAFALPVAVQADAATLVLTATVVDGYDLSCTARSTCTARYLRADEKVTPFTLTGEGQYPYGSGVFTEASGDTFRVDFMGLEGVTRVSYDRDYGSSFSSLLIERCCGRVESGQYAFDARGRYTQSGRFLTVAVTSVTLDGQEIGVFVPEPSTWLMLVLGFGITGAALRSRRRTLALA
jgi:hypothetical protein